MEFYLMKDQTVKFNETVVGFESAERRSEAFPVILEPLAPDCKVSKKYCKIIVNLAGGSSDESELKLSGHKWRAEVTIPDATSAYKTIIIREASRPVDGLSLYRILGNLFPDENLSFHLTIKDLDINYSCGCITALNLESKKSDLFFNKITFPRHEIHPEASIIRDLTSGCRMTLTFGISHDPLQSLSPENPALKNKRLLDETIGSDLVIVASNGAELKCHKCHLMVSSDAFRAMFENEMEEGTTNRLELPDMSEAGVRAFLTFIYTSDLEAASEKCDIAFELFRAGDKYGMVSLKDAMKTLICSKPAKWFSVDMAVRLALLVQNMEEKEVILKKVAEVLKWYSQNSSADLIASEEYPELFRTDPQTGMELFGAFLKYS